MPKYDENSNAEKNIFVFFFFSISENASNFSHFMNVVVPIRQTFESVQHSFRHDIH